MSDAPMRSSRRALARLRRSLEKAERELAAVRAALGEAGDADGAAAGFDEAAQHLATVAAFVEEQAQRLQERILLGGGIAPGRLGPADRPRSGG